MAEEKKGMSKGCLVGLIVLGVLAVLIIVTGIVCYIYKDELIEMGLNKVTESVATELKANLPEGVSAEEVDQVMDKFKTSLKEGKIDDAELQSISMSFQNAYEDKKIDQKEAEDLYDQIKKIVED